MCGVVGLLLKDPGLEPELGALLTPMIVALSDRGPDSVKEKIQATLDHFLSDSWSSELSAVDTEKLIVSNPGPTAPP